MSHTINCSAWNFRCKWCRGLKKGTWLYDLLDCKRYEPTPPEPPAPHDYEDEVGESIRVGETLTDELIPKPTQVCPRPYHKTGELRVYSATILSGLAMKETPDWSDSLLHEYYDSLVIDGVNAERNFSTVAPCDPLDPLDYWRFYDPQYLGVVKKRLDLIKERDLTEIVCVHPYRMGISDDQARWLIRELKGYLPNIIFEAMNEPYPHEQDRNRRIVETLLAEGIPRAHIQVQYVECGAWGDMMEELDLKGKCLVSSHWMGSMETVNDIFSGGTAQTILSWGMFCGSNDGPDKLLKSKGLNFWHNAQAGLDNRRPDNGQLSDITGWLLSHNGAGYEMLSASGYQSSAFPSMNDVIAVGKAERTAMAVG